MFIMKVLWINHIQTSYKNQLETFFNKDYKGGDGTWLGLS